MSWHETRHETRQGTTTQPATPELPKRPTWTSLRRGFLGRCPACGRGRLFRAFLKVADNRPACGAALHHHQADDAPAYFVILIVGHLIVPLALVVEIAWSPPYWLHAAIWLPLTAGLAVGLLTHQGRDRRLAMGELHARIRSECGSGSWRRGC
jgi:uncharacterized protein (DUF983 family)